MVDRIERYCGIAADGIQSGPALVYVVHRLTNRGVVLDKQVARLFFGCNGFRTLTTHGSDYLNHLAAAGIEHSQRESVHQSLQCLADQGMFIGESEWLNSVTSDKGQQEGQCRIGAVGVVTKDRPFYVRRCLESIASNLAASNRSCRVCVYDDSTTQETFDIVAGLRRRILSTASLAYCGPRQRALYLSQLRGLRQIPPETLDFALCGDRSGLPQYGVNMNWFLLDTAKSMAVCLDDDVLCTPGLPKGYAKGLNVSSAANLYDMRIHGDREGALQSVRFKGSLDFLSLHERLLGRSVRDCLVEFANSGLRLTDISPSFMTKLLDGEGSVLVTMMGIAGESGTSQRWIGMSGAPLERLWKRARLDPALLDSREVVRAPRQLTIADFPWFMNYACAVDNRTFLPPFLPMCRNMDGVFAMTMRSCFPKQYIGHLPWVVAHDPPSRDWRLYEGYEPRLSELLVSAIASHQVERNSVDPAANLRAVGHHLTHIGTLPRRDFEEWLRRHYFHHLVGVLGRAESAFREADAVGFSSLKEHCRHHLEEVEKALSCVEDISARDIRSGRTSEESLEMTQVAIRGFGDLLVWWPAIVSLSVATKASGAVISDCGE
jgi:hypothetical protein